VSGGELERSAVGCPPNPERRGRAKLGRMSPEPLQVEMRRRPPNSVMRYLRQEVGFACPVPDCGDPILELHHFDPPWHLEHHHRPEGMIALCRKHHAAADHGLLTKEQLRSFKRAYQPRSLVQSKCPWFETSVIWRLGGCYAHHTPTILSLGREPILQEASALDGRLLISARVRQADGKLAFELDRNVLTAYVGNMYDLQLTTSGTAMKMWLRRQDIGLDLHVGHKTPEEFENLVAADEDAATTVGGYRKTHCKQRPLDQENYSVDHSVPSVSPLLSYAREHCVNSDGLIPIIDIRNLHTYSPSGRSVRVRNGILSEVRFSRVTVSGCYAGFCVRGT